MRKIAVLEHVSLDGYIAGRNGEMDWIIYDEQIQGYVTGLLETTDLVLYGRTTYQMMEGFWPKAAEDPNVSAYHAHHARWINRTQKIVFSGSLQQAHWENTRLIASNIEAALTRLKNQAGNDIVVIGSASIVHLLLQSGLIDEYWLTVNPVVLGGGLPLFRDLKSMTRLRLASSKEFDSGVIGLRYAAR